MSQAELHAALLRALDTGDSKLKRTPTGHTFRCPAPGHEDSTPSAWMGERGWKCMGCGAGGSLHDLADLLGVEYERGYTLERYAADKRFSISKLQGWGLETVRERGFDTLLIRYLDHDEQLLRRRYRGIDGRRWWEGKNRRIWPYGLWRLPDVQGAGVLLCEGESDCHAAWHGGLHALGLPGANTWRSEWADYLAGTDLYVWEEPDEGGAAFVASIVRDFPDAKVVSGAAAGVKDMAALWRTDPKAFAASMAGLMAAAAPAGLERPLVAIDEVTPALLAQAAVELSRPVDAIPTHLPAWNHACCGLGGRQGLAKGWHVVVGARSGSGKTLMASNLAAAALRAGRPTTILSLEMTQLEMLVRTAAIVGEVPIAELEAGGFRPDTWAKATKVLDSYRADGGSLYLNREPLGSLEQIRSAITYEHEVHGSQLFLIDYLQLAWTGSAMTIYDRITEVSHGIRALAKQLRVVTVGFSQLNRPASNSNEKPRRESLLGGSSLENDADQVLLLDHSRWERAPGTGNILSWLLLCKNRHGMQVEVPTLLDVQTLAITERLVAGPTSGRS